MRNRFFPTHLTVWIDPSTMKKEIAKYEDYILTGKLRSLVPFSWVKQEPEYYLGYWKAVDLGYIQA